MPEQYITVPWLPWLAGWQVTGRQYAAMRTVLGEMARGGSLTANEIAAQTRLEVHRVCMGMTIARDLGLIEPVEPEEPSN